MFHILRNTLVATIDKWASTIWAGTMEQYVEEYKTNVFSCLLPAYENIHLSSRSLCCLEQFKAIKCFSSLCVGLTWKKIFLFSPFQTIKKLRRNVLKSGLEWYIRKQVKLNFNEHFSSIFGFESLPNECFLDTEYIFH